MSKRAGDAGARFHVRGEKPVLFATGKRYTIESHCCSLNTLRPQATGERPLWSANTHRRS
jgi:hypothetical protein